MCQQILILQNLCLKSRLSLRILRERMAENISKRKRQRRPNVDIISTLPDPVIGQILLQLPTKDVVKTSPLSTRWRRQWRLTPGLDLASSDFPNHRAFIGFVDRFLDLVREENSCLHKLKLSIEKKMYDSSCVRRWIDFVVKGKLQHLDFECGMFMHGTCLDVIPLRLFICETLIHLRLVRVVLGNIKSVNLPLLKTMSLECNLYASDASLAFLISSCVALEDLRIVKRLDDKLTVLRVHSQTLTSFSIDFAFGEFWLKLSRLDRGNSELSIDAPKLKYLYLIDEVSESKIIVNSSSLAKVHFDGCFDIQFHYDGAGSSKNQMARNFFTGISGVRDMIISENAIKFFPSYLAVESLPQFCNLSRLETVLLYSSDVPILSTILESCPNLKAVVLSVICTGLERLTYSTSLPSPVSISCVPQCLLSSLEFVEIKNIFKGRCVETQVLRYFLENSLVLKELLVHLRRSKPKKSMVVLRELLALPRPSRCGINYVGDDDDDDCY